MSSLWVWDSVATMEGRPFRAMPYSVTGKSTLAISKAAQLFIDRHDRRMRNDWITSLPWNRPDILSGYTRRESLQDSFSSFVAKSLHKAHVTRLASPSPILGRAEVEAFIHEQEMIQWYGSPLKLGY
jgi:hypothetical protein